MPNFIHRYFLQLILLLISYPLVLCSESLSVQAAREIYVEVDQARLYCKVMGNGDPIIVIHGGPGLSQDYLLPHMAKLAEDHQVIFYDQRGGGKSTGEINSETIRTDVFLKDLEAIRKNFGIKKMALLGHSWGGFLAMKYAIVYPDHVSRLILSNSMPASSEEFSLFVQELMRRLETYQPVLQSLTNSQKFQEGDPETHERYYRLIFQQYCCLPAKANLLNLQMSPPAAKHALKINELMRLTVFEKPFNLHAELKKLKIPTLIIHGDCDPVPVKAVTGLHASLPHSQFIVLKNCGHFPYIEDPLTYFNHLNLFLNPLPMPMPLPAGMGEEINYTRGLFN